MKRNACLLITCFLLLFGNSLSAQKQVKFEIRHWLGNVPFALEVTSQNSLGIDFNVSRLEYYISEITITHDTGKVTMIPDYWLLVDPSQATLVDLGNLDIDQVEAISFHVGVDSAHNHLDPAQYPVTHPLGPKSPSMHWGWASGYRFIAIEGKSGLNLRSDYQLHGLGDRNYLKTEIENPMLSESSQEIIISVDADYAKVLQGMDISQPLQIHGEFKEAQRALINMRDFVFTAADPSTSIASRGFENRLKLFPNPSNGEAIHLRLPDGITHSFRVVLSDVYGRHLFEKEAGINDRVLSFSLHQSGLYFVSVFQAGKMMASKKLTVRD